MSPKQDFYDALAPIVKAAVKLFNEHGDEPFINPDGEPDTWDATSCWYKACEAVEPDLLIKLYELDLRRTDYRYFDDRYLAKVLKEFIEELFNTGVVGLITRRDPKFIAALVEALADQLSDGAPLELFEKLDPKVPSRDKTRAELLHLLEQHLETGNQPTP